MARPTIRLDLETNPGSVRISLIECHLILNFIDCASIWNFSTVLIRTNLIKYDWLCCFH